MDERPNNKRVFDLRSWPRSRQFDFYREYEDPYFNVTVPLNASRLLQFSRDHGLSFFLCCLYCACETANSMQEFRLRTDGETIWEMDSLDIGSTVLMEDETFAFCYFERKGSLEEFHASGRLAMEKTKKEGSWDEAAGRLDLVYCSFLPWLNFTSFKHATSVAMNASGIPKFVFGKYYGSQDSLHMPFSIEVHHALMDGLHVGRFVERLQAKMDQLSLNG